MRWKYMQVSTETMIHMAKYVDISFPMKLFNGFWLLKAPKIGDRKVGRLVRQIVKHERKIIALCLALFAAITITVSPAIAYIPEPMFDVSWRPDLCADGSPGVYMCVELFLYIQEQNNAAIYDSRIDIYGLFTCLDWDCKIATYTQEMNQIQQQTCTYTFIGQNDEMSSWCVAEFNATIRYTLDAWGYGTCTGACIQKGKSNDRRKNQTNEINAEFVIRQHRGMSEIPSRFR